MYCEHCGTKKEESAIFCQNCGKKANGKTEQIKNESATASVAPVNPTALGDGEFYSKEWNQSAFFVVSSFPTVDILIDKENLYIVKLPKYNGSTTGAILGFLLLSIIGLAIGSSMGASSDRKKREWYRSAWVDANGEVTSHEYLNNLAKQIPLSELKNKITFGTNKLTIQIGEKKVTLKHSQIELDKLKIRIQSYVL